MDRKRPNKERKKTLRHPKRRGSLSRNGGKAAPPTGSSPRRRWRILQINLNGCRMAQDLLTQTAAELGAEIVVISEPWKPPSHWFMDPSGKAGVWITERGAKANKKIVAVGCKEGAVAVEIDGTYVVSCYYSPNVPFRTYEERLGELQELLTGCDLDRTLVMGDLNAKSPAWGS
ncbi:uncharacterized protein LOC144477547, partial [Augochlora pura]